MFQASRVPSGHGFPAAIKNPQPDGMRLANSSFWLREVYLDQSRVSSRGRATETSVPRVVSVSSDQAERSSSIRARAAVESRSD